MIKFDPNDRLTYPPFNIVVHVSLRDDSEFTFYSFLDESLTWNYQGGYGEDGFNKTLKLDMVKWWAWMVEIIDEADDGDSIENREIKSLSDRLELEDIAA